MKQHSFNQVASITFLLVALVHFLRITEGWDAVINGWFVPMWVSWLAVLVAGFLATNGLRLGKSRA